MDSPVPRSGTNKSARRLVALILLCLSAQSRSDDPAARNLTLTDDRRPLPFRHLEPEESERFRQGEEVFNTHWLPAGTADPGRLSGLGPLFNADSCDSCHNGAAHGQGPVGDGPAPVALVVRLESPSASIAAEPGGDPVYGRVFNTKALEGVRVEGIVTVEYREISGSYYPGGGYWRIREPSYHFVQLNYGPLAPTTVIKPRLAPALFGLGLLERVPDSAIAGEARDKPPTAGGMHGAPQPTLRRAIATGRFGWQANSRSIRDQTTKALALEMGLTSSDRPSDDCTPTQIACLNLPAGGSPEVPDESLDSVVTFLRLLAVPKSPAGRSEIEPGPRIFAALGCDACHRPELPIETIESDPTRSVSAIAPYSDLRLHDLGPRMADKDLSGNAVPTRWRTAPLWGLGFRVMTESHPTFLHDGRARSTEEAILWHLGDAARSQRRFRELSPGRRDTLLRWLETL